MVARRAHPLLPVVDLFPQLLGDPVALRRRRRRAALPAGGEHRCLRLTRAERDRGPDVLAVPFERKRGLQERGRPGRPEGRPALCQLEPVGCPRVVEAGAAFEGEAHRAAHRADHTHQGVPVGRREAPVDGHVVDGLADPVGGHEAGHHDRGVRIVELLPRPFGLFGREQEVSTSVVVEQRGEDAGGVEPRRREPVDHSLGRDQSGGLQVPDEPVVGDGRIAVHGSPPQVGPADRCPVTAVAPRGGLRRARRWRWPSVRD